MSARSVSNEAARTSTLRRIQTTTTPAALLWKNKENFPNKKLIEIKCEENNFISYFYFQIVVVEFDNKKHTFIDVKIFRHMRYMKILFFSNKTFSYDFV